MLGKMHIDLVFLGIFFQRNLDQALAEDVEGYCFKTDYYSLPTSCLPKIWQNKMLGYGQKFFGKFIKIQKVRMYNYVIE